MRIRSFLLVVAVASTACTKPSDGPVDEPIKAKSEAVEVAEPVKSKPAVAPGVAQDGSIISAVQWFEGSLEVAIEKAKTEDKLVLVDVGAYWCPPCHRLDEEVFTDAAVGTFLSQGYVAVHVDAEKGDGPQIAEQYRVQAFPSVLVLDSSGNERGRVVDFLPPAAWMAAVDKASKGATVLEELVDKVAADPDDTDTRYRLGHAYALAAQRDKAEEQFEAVLLADPNDELGLANRVLYDRALFFTYKLDGDPATAIAQFEELQRKYPESKQATRAYRSMGRLLHEMGKTDEAIAKLDAMLATDPQDVALARSYGWFSFRQKCRPARGLEVVESALERETKDADLYYLRAELLDQLDRAPQALEAIRKASELEPKSAYYKRQVRRFEAQVGA